MALQNDGLRFSPPWISPAAGKPDREVPQVIIVQRKRAPAGGGTLGNFVALGQTGRSWRGMTTLGSDVYACVVGNDIYKQTGGTGNFVALNQTSRGWSAMTTLGSDVYACVFGGDIYKAISA